MSVSIHQEGIIVNVPLITPYNLTTIIVQKVNTVKLVESA